MKNKARALIVVGFLIAICFLSSFVVADEDARGDFPCDAGGPYVGIAEVVPWAFVDSIPVYFDGWSDPPFGKIAYNWSFGDGEYGYGRNPVHEYEEPGEYDVLMEVFVPPYYSNDTTTSTIYSNKWNLTVDIDVDGIAIVQQGNIITFKGRVMAEYGLGLDDSSPFNLTFEIWNGDFWNPTSKRHTIYWYESGPLGPGNNTGWKYKDYPANLAPGWYWAIAKVVFPNGRNTELCQRDEVRFLVIDL